MTSEEARQFQGMIYNLMVSFFYLLTSESRIFWPIRISFTRQTRQKQSKWLKFCENSGFVFSELVIRSGEQVSVLGFVIFRTLSFHLKCYEFVFSNKKCFIFFLKTLPETLKSEYFLELRSSKDFFDVDTDNWICSLFIFIWHA